MAERTNDAVTRRTFMAGAAVITAGAVAAVACSEDDDPKPAASATAGGSPAAAASPAESATAAGQATLDPTPACMDDDDPTIEQTEGPYFTPNSPERADLRETGLAGTPLTVSGFVLGSDCQPQARALLDFWQCDNDGIYDNDGYRLRGHQFTGDDGAFKLETIVPGIYPGRTRHIHVKVQREGGSVLTTQLYFPDDAAANAADGIFDERLLMDVRASGNIRLGSFNFVLA
jgi:protocatechuate 3,4-dioxygenase beta subunit